MQLSNMMTQHQIFYVVIIPFITFFFLFAFWMYPQRGVSTPNQCAP